MHIHVDGWLTTYWSSASERVSTLHSRRMLFILKYFQSIKKEAYIYISPGEGNRTRGSFTLTIQKLFWGNCPTLSCSFSLSTFFSYLGESPPTIFIVILIFQLFWRLRVLKPSWCSNYLGTVWSYLPLDCFTCLMFAVRRVRKCETVLHLAAVPPHSTAVISAASFF